MDSSARKPERVIILSELFYPETTSTGYYLTEIAVFLAQRFPLKVLCAVPAFGPAQPPSETYRGVEIQRLGRMRPLVSAIFARTVWAISRTARMFYALLLQLRREDLVLVVTNPPFLPPAVALACLLRRARFVYLIHDIYPQAAIVAGILEPRSIGVWVWGKLQRWVYRRADRIVCLGRDARELISLFDPKVSEKLVLIENWAEIEAVRPLAKSDSGLWLPRNLWQKFVVLYAGNLGRTHDPEMLVDAARRLEGEPDIVFVVAGAGSQFADLAGQILRDPRPNLVAVPLRAAREEQARTLAAGDIVLIIFKPGMRGVSVPSRMYNAMAAGKAIIGVADAKSELALVIHEERIGWVVAPGDRASLARAIMDAQSDRDRLQQMGLRARIAAETRYSPGSILSKYGVLLESLIRDPSHL